LGAVLAVPCAAPSRVEAQAPPSGGELVVTTTVLPLLDETGPDARGLAVDLNDRGVVVGSSGLWPTLWRRGEVVALTDDEPPDGGYGTAVNERGEVIVNRLDRPLTRWFRGRTTELDLGPESRLWQLGGFNDRGQALLLRWVTQGAEIGIWEPDGSFTPIPAPEGYSIEPVALSEAGHVVGNLVPLGGGYQTRPFVWKDGELTVLAEWGLARGVNRRGQVAGLVFDPDDPDRWPLGRATVWDDGEEIPVVPDEVRYSSVEDINDRGQVVGVWAAGAEAGHAYLWDDGTMIELVAPNGRTPAPTQVNERGQVVGYYSVDTATFRAFFWDHGDVVDLGPGIGPRDLNDRGQALGRLLVDPVNGQERPIMWTVRRRR
jgi:probable HAF family extracellular repeat protein